MSWPFKEERLLPLNMIYARQDVGALRGLLLNKDFLAWFEERYYPLPRSAQGRILVPERVLAHLIEVKKYLQDQGLDNPEQLERHLIEQAFHATEGKIYGPDEVGEIRRILGAGNAEKRVQASKPTPRDASPKTGKATEEPSSEAAKGAPKKPTSPPSPKPQRASSRDSTPQKGKAAPIRTPPEQRRPPPPPPNALPPAIVARIEQLEKRLALIEKNDGRKNDGPDLAELEKRLALLEKSDRQNLTDIETRLDLAAKHYRKLEAKLDEIAGLVKPLTALEAYVNDLKAAGERLRVETDKRIQGLLERLTQIEGQLATLDPKQTTSGPDPTLIHRLEGIEVEVDGIKHGLEEVQAALKLSEEQMAVVAAELEHLIKRYQEQQPQKQKVPGFVIAALRKMRER